MTIISFRSFVVSLIEELNLPHTLNKRFTNEGSMSIEGSLNSAWRKGGGGGVRGYGVKFGSSYGPYVGSRFDRDVGKNPVSRSKLTVS